MLSNSNHLSFAYIFLDRSQNQHILNLYNFQYYTYSLEYCFLQKGFLFTFFFVPFHEHIYLSLGVLLIVLFVFFFPNDFSLCDHRLVDF